MRRSDLSLSTLDLLGDTTWGWIALAGTIAVLALGLFAKILDSGITDDLTRDELRLLRAFNEQAKGGPRAYLSVEFAAYRAEVGKYVVKLRRLKVLGYLRDSNINAGYLGHRSVWITADGIRRASSRQ
jgi:hypothetical protein